MDKSSIDRLIDIIHVLRGPNGCPWDKEQTFQSLIPYIIEEAYELTDAMRQAQAGSVDNLKEELGDVLLHVVMLSAMAQEAHLFDFNQVADLESEKMIRRHPHVFGNVQVDSVEAVWKNWEAIKKSEKTSPDTTEAHSSMGSIPRYLPALMRAYKIQKKAAKQGFDWPDTQGALEKLKEECSEIEAVVHAEHNNKEALKEEFGDLFFSMVNVARKMGIDPEEALDHCNQKFLTRFRYIETTLHKDGKEVSQVSLEVLETLWEKAKKGFIGI